MTAPTIEPKHKDDPIPAAIERVREDEAEEIYDFLSQLGSTGEMKVELFRKEPIRYKGVKTDGLLEVYREPINYDQIRDMHGGGKYQVRVNIRNKKGRWEYAGARTFDIAGKPRLDSLLNAGDDEDEDGGGAPVPSAPDGAINQALSMAHSLVSDSRREAQMLRESSRRNGNSDETTLRMIDKLDRQIEILQGALTQKDERILELLGKKPDTSGQDQLLAMYRESNTDHSARIGEIRLAHDSELRQLRDYHSSELRMREQRFEKEIDSVRAGHAREVDSLKDSHRSAMDAQKNGFEMRIDGLKETIKRLEREVSEARTEVAGLRAKKEQGPLDQIQGLVALKTGLESLMPASGDDDKPSSTAERVIAALMESPVAQGLASRIAGPEPTQAQQIAAPEMVGVRRADGTVVQVPRSYIDQMRAQQAAAANGGAPIIDKNEVSVAVQFIEQAYKNGHPPETVAASARNLVPKAILDHIKKMGVDSFLNEVADLSDSSPLATVAGRIYVRKIAKFLLEGTTEGVDEEVAEPAVDFEGEVDGPAEGEVE